MFQRPSSYHQLYSIHYPMIKDIKGKWNHYINNHVQSKHLWLRIIKWLRKMFSGILCRASLFFCSELVWKISPEWTRVKDHSQLSSSNWWPYFPSVEAWSNIEFVPSFPQLLPFVSYFVLFAPSWWSVHLRVFKWLRVCSVYC